MEKYPFLRTAARILKIFAWVQLAVGIISSIVFGVGSGGAITGFLVIIIGILYSIIGWVFLTASAELFLLFIDVEANTRKAAEAQK